MWIKQLGIVKFNSDSNPSKTFFLVGIYKFVEGFILSFITYSFDQFLNKFLSELPSL